MRWPTRELSPRENKLSRYAKCEIAPCKSHSRQEIPLFIQPDPELIHKLDKKRINLALRGSETGKIRIFL